MSFIAVNCAIFMLRDLGRLTNRFHCNSQHEALMNRFWLIKQMKINLAGKGLLKMRAFSWKCVHFKENACIFGKCVKIRAFSTENAKNKFSDIGLASSKGLFFERPKKADLLQLFMSLPIILRYYHYPPSPMAILFVCHRKRFVVLVV